MERISIFLLIVIIGQNDVLTSLIDNHLSILRANAKEEAIRAPGMTRDALFTDRIAHLSEHSLTVRLQLELPRHHFPIVYSAIWPREAQKERLLWDEGDLCH